MADSYSLVDGQVVPYSGGRMHTDTSSWRDATDLEIELSERVAELEKAVKDALSIAESSECDHASAPSALADIIKILDV